MNRFFYCLSLLLLGLLFWPTSPAAAGAIEVAISAEVVDAPPPLCGCGMRAAKAATHAKPYCGRQRHHGRCRRR